MEVNSKDRDGGMEQGPQHHLGRVATRAPRLFAARSYNKAGVF